MFCSGNVIHLSERCLVHCVCVFFWGWEGLGGGGLSCGCAVCKVSRLKYLAILNYTVLCSWVVVFFSSNVVLRSKIVYWTYNKMLEAT